MAGQARILLSSLSLLRSKLARGEVWDLLSWEVGSSHETARRVVVRCIMKCHMIDRCAAALALGALLALGACDAAAPPVGAPIAGRVSNDLGMELVAVQPGAFTMGSPVGEPGRDEDEVPHVAIVAAPFYLQVTEVTQAQWEAVMGTNPSRFVGPDRPVDSVSWDDAVAFAEALSAREGVRYRLPTEAEWEYACRAGSVTAYAFGERLAPSQANVRGGAAGTVDNGMVVGAHAETADVASYPANAWGLHDMHGNVWEWTADRYAPYAGTSAEDTPPERRVLRGGGWSFSPEAARSAVRLALEPTRRYDLAGFRLVREVGP